MVHGWRGLGKTHVGLGISAAIACGGSFLDWKAPARAPVLFVDGEMCAQDLQQWVSEALAGQPAGPCLLRIIADDLQENGLPSLATPEGRQIIEQYLGGAKLVVFDNLVSLFRTPNGTNPDSEWIESNEWFKSLKHRGVAVLLIHHEGKG